MLYPAGLFLAAGRLDWVNGWLYSAIFVTGGPLSRVLAAHYNPGIVEERANFAAKRDQKSWDRPLMPLVAIVGPLFTWLVAGLDQRFHWSRGVPAVLQVAGFACVLFGYALGTWALVANRFFSAVVRIQKERGHSVYSGGPYRYLRHPGYAGGLLAMLGTPPALGSWWALVPAVAEAGLYVLRTWLEDKTLQAELTGYREYAARVRYRLLPGVW